MPEKANFNLTIVKAKTKFFFFFFLVFTFSILLPPGAEGSTFKSVQKDYFLVLPDCEVYKYTYICKEYIILYLILIEYCVKSWLRGEKIGAGPEKNNDHN